MKINAVEINKLINAAQAFNSQSVAMLFELLYEKLYLIAWSIIKDHQNSKDFIHEAFTELMQIGVARFKDSDEVECFLKKHIKKSCFAHLKECKTRTNTNLLDELVEDNGDNEMINADLLQRLRELYNKLPVERKELLKLQIFDGASPKEVADNLAIKTEAVHALNYSTLLKLKNALLKR